MFDSQKPYNELPSLPPKADFNDVQLLKLVNKANNSLFELKGSALVLPNMNILLSPFGVREAVASSGIENINTTVIEALKADVLLTKKEQSGPEKETLHYRDALMAGFELLKKNGFLSINSFIEIQSVLEPNKYGIRKIPGVKIANQVTQEIIYTPPEGFNVISEKLKNFEKYFNDVSDFDEADPLIKMAVLHYQFEAIHPFLDGNGRTGRILMVLYLVLVGRLDLPILFLSKYILENRSEYYRLLNNVSRNNEWKEWIMYMLSAVDMQAQATGKDIIKIKELIDQYKKSEIIKKSNVITPQLLDYLFSNPFYSQKNLSDNLNVHRNTAARYFSELERLNIVKKFKYKQQNVYFNQEFLDILSY